MDLTGNPRDVGGEYPIRVVLADDHTEFREGLKEMLATDGNIEVVGEAENGAVAVELAQKALPDVIILDLAMPVMEGREALGLILQKVSPPPRARAPENGGERLPGQERVPRGSHRHGQAIQPETPAARGRQRSATGYIERRFRKVQI